jgi:thymidylate kinase
MFTVALVGPDGAGKTTIGRLLARELPLPVKQIYMGVNADASTMMLPTTRLILAVKRARGKRPDLVASTGRERGAPPARDRLRRGLGGVKAGARLTVWLSEEWFRQVVAWYYVKARRQIVVFDRHFFADYYAYDVVDDDRQRPLASRVHGFLLDRVYPKPDLVIFLDAPADVLFARKPEASVEWLAGRREEYLRLADVLPHFARVDASRPPAEVAREVASVILRFRESVAADGRRGDGRGRPA